MLFDMNSFSISDGVIDFPTWQFGGGPRPVPIEEWDTITGTTADATANITGTVNEQPLSGY